MRIALDTSVISALWSIEPAASLVSSQLGKFASKDHLLICAPVYVELMAHPKTSETFLEHFFKDSNIAVEFETAEQVWKESARRWARYAERRRRSSGTDAKRLLVDFLIGTHALFTADRLFTLDKGRYKTDFPDLNLI